MTGPGPGNPRPGGTPPPPPSPRPLEPRPIRAQYMRGEPLPKPPTGEPPPPPTPRFAPLASLQANPALAHASPGLSAAPRPTPTG